MTVIGCEVLLEIVRQRFVDAGRHGVGDRRHENRVAVGRGLGGLVRAERAAGAADIFDDDGWPSRAESACPMMRATMSVVPPGANGTISVTGCVGQSSATAARGSAKVRRAHAQANCDRNGFQPDHGVLPLFLRRSYGLRRGQRNSPESRRLARHGFCKRRDRLFGGSDARLIGAVRGGEVCGEQASPAKNRRSSTGAAKRRGRPHGPATHKNRSRARTDRAPQAEAASAESFGSKIVADEACQLVDGEMRRARLRLLLRVRARACRRNSTSITGRPNGRK